MDVKNSCALCNSLSDKTDANHKIFHCKKFSTPQSKLTKLKELGGCTRCGFLGHKVDNCNFRFNGRCINCKTFHAYFLCTKTNKIENEGNSSGSTQSGKKGGSNAMQSSTCATELVVMQSYAAKSDNLLPTVTAKLRNSNLKGHKDVRVLYDTASQSSFATEKLLQKVKHKVTRKNVNVKIIGFNNSETYNTKNVQLECQ